MMNGGEETSVASCPLGKTASRIHPVSALIERRCNLRRSASFTIRSFSLHLVSLLRGLQLRTTDDGRLLFRSSFSIQHSLLSLLALSLAACHRYAAPPNPYVAFVANHGSNSVAAADLASFRVMARVPVAPGPEQLAVRPMSQEIYATGDSGSVDIILFPDLRVVKTLHVGASARDVVFTPNGRYAFVLDPSEGQIAFLDCDSRWETGRLRIGGPGSPPLGHLVITPEGAVLIASDPSANRLVLVSTAGREIVGSVDVGKAPGALALLPDGSKVFVADTEEDKISAADVASRQILSHLEINSRPSWLLAKPDGGELLVFSRESATMTIVDAFHDNVEEIRPTGRDPVAAVIKPDQSDLFIANAGDGSVMAVDLPTRTVLASTRTGSAPSALALTPDGRFLAVADRSESSLAILHVDPAALKALAAKPRATPSLLLTTIPVGAEPVDVKIPGWLR
ncbi:MAG: hypothetical protein ACLQOO_27315 [Terriglobia bacterium]